MCVLNGGGWLCDTHQLWQKLAKLELSQRRHHVVFGEFGALCLFGVLERAASRAQSAHKRTAHVGNLSNAKGERARPRGERSRAYQAVT